MNRSQGLGTSLLFAGGAIWMAAVVWGFGALFGFEARPGEAWCAPARWPQGAGGIGGELDPERCTLLLFAHPRCPCTRATLGELERLAARCGDRLACRVVFYADPELGEGWERTDLWERAQRIPRAEVAADPGGEIARRFGARTSGHALLYAPDGRLLFQGGITRSRGHAGDNPGEDAVERLVRGEACGLDATPVFGCPLSEGTAAGTAPGTFCPPGESP